MGTPVTGATPPRGRTPTSDRPGAGWLTHAAWLSDDVLLLLGVLPRRLRREPHAVIGGVVAETIATVPYADPDRTATTVPTAVLARVPRGAAEHDAPIAVEVGRESLTLDATAPRDLRALMREGLAWLDAPERTRLVETLAAAVARAGVDSRRGLRLMRDGLRERLPAAVVDPHHANVVHIDVLMGIGDVGLYIEGWTLEPPEGAVALTAISPEGDRIELLDRVHRYPRADIAALAGHGGRPAPERAGFVCYFEPPQVPPSGEGWIIELRDGSGAGVEAAAPPVRREPEAARAMLLGDLALERLPEDSLRVLHIRPAMTRLLERSAADAEVDRVVQYGAPPESPRASIVVPLYGRIDFLESQLAEFVHDPELRTADIVYVLDSPESAEALDGYAEQLARLYAVPFRVAYMRANGGFSRANNLGAALATGTHLLLLNSDVIPDAPGWLGAMADFLDAHPSAGAVAPKLLYEDGSIQHAGLYFDRPTGAHLWTNEHFFKGLHGSLPAACRTREVPAVTAACMMLRRQTYLDVGGLRGVFVQGDYEDSDLCLRLAEAGLEVWYLADVQLFHLEGQSYPSELRASTTEYNKWLHTHLWRARLGAMAASSEDAPGRR